MYTFTRVQFGNLALLKEQYIAQVSIGSGDDDEFPVSRSRRDYVAAKMSDFDKLPLYLRGVFALPDKYFGTNQEIEIAKVHKEKGWDLDAAVLSKRDDWKCGHGRIKVMRGHSFWAVRRAQFSAVEFIVIQSSQSNLHQSDAITLPG
jgi:hypothetical protein